MWDLMEGVWKQRPERVLSPRAMADHVMGATLAPMERSDVNVLH